MGCLVDHLYTAASFVRFIIGLCTYRCKTDLSSFNAVFFTSSKAHQYSVAVVSPAFFNDTSWIPTAVNSAPENFEALGGYTNKAQYYVRPNNATIVTLLDDARGSNASLEFTGLDPSACMGLYAADFLQRASDVVVVTNSTSQSSSPLIWTRYPQRAISQDKESTNPDPYNWVCHDALQQNTLSEARVSHTEGDHPLPLTAR